MSSGVGRCKESLLDYDKNYEQSRSFEFKSVRIDVPSS